jgi:hypothetical protein
MNLTQRAQSVVDEDLGKKTDPWMEPRARLAYEATEYSRQVAKVRDPRTGPFERGYLHDQIEDRERRITNLLLTLLPAEYVESLVTAIAKGGYTDDE